MEADLAPFPGAELAWRVAGTDDANWFHASGRRSADELSAALGAVGRDWDSFDNALDFGCGCGRVLLHLETEAAGTQLTGVDIDAEAIRWAEANIPWVRFAAIDPEPPLPFADEAFDLVVNHSVFSHLDKRRQDSWLAELRRVTRPGATLVLDVQGPSACPAPLRPRLFWRGYVYVADAEWRGAFPDWYQNAYHTPRYVFEHWARWFDVRAYVVRGALDLLDVVVLERPAGAPRGVLRHLPARVPGAWRAAAAVRRMQTRLSRRPSSGSRPSRRG